LRAFPHRATDHQQRIAHPLLSQFLFADEYKYRGTLFIKDELFSRRMEYLKRNNYPILSLDNALGALSKGRLPPCTTVITMDDGWRGVYTQALPILRELQIPVTVYVATYYVENQIPVFPVASSYLFWVTTERRAVLPRGLGTFELASQAQAHEAEELAQSFGALLPPADQLEFLRELARSLNVPFGGRAAANVPADGRASAARARRRGRRYSAAFPQPPVAAS
jgi:hypothetical protein